MGRNRIWVSTLIAAGFLTLSVGGWIGYASLRGSAQPVSNYCNPIDSLLSDGDGKSFALEFSGQGDLDWTKIFADKSSKSPAAQRVDFSLKANWFMTPIDQEDDHVLFANQLTISEFSLKHSQGAHSASDSDTISRLSQSFFFEMNRRGEILSIQTDPNQKAAEKNIIRWLVAQLQIVLPVNFDPSTRLWTVNEYDPNGLYEASYELKPGTFGGFYFNKKNNRYLELKSLNKKRHRRMAGSIKRLAFRMENKNAVEGTFSCVDKAYRKITASVNTTTSLNQNEFAKNKSHLLLEFKKRTPAAEIDRAKLLASFSGVQTSGVVFGLVSTEDLEDAEKRIQKAELGNLDQRQVLDLLSKAKASGDPERVEALYLKIKALIYLNPEASEALGKLLLTEDPKSKTMQVVATALSTVGSPEAQAALRVALNERSESVDAAEVLVPALGMTELPTPESEEALKRLIQTSKHEAVVSVAGLSLGIMASHLGDQFPERESKIVEGVIRDYENAETTSQKQYLISVLGNAGSEVSRSVINDALKSGEVSLKEEATRALRGLPGKEVDDQILRLAAGEGGQEVGVKKSAAFALGFREPTPELSEQAKKLYSAESSDEVRTELLKSVFQFREADPGVRDFLKSVQEKDPNQELRKMASDFYQISGDS